MTKPFSIIYTDNSPGGSRVLGFVLRNVTYHDIIGMASDVIFYRDTTDTNGSESLSLFNCKFLGMSATFGGTHNANQYNPAPGNHGISLFNAATAGSIEIGDQNSGVGGAGNTFVGGRRFAATEEFMTLNAGVDVDNRFELRADGRQVWGDGTNSPDVGIEREAAGVLGLTNGSTGGSGLEGTEITDLDAPAAAKGRIYFRDTGGKTELVCRFETGAIQRLAIEP